VVAQSLRTGERRQLVSGGDARYIPTGHLVFVIRDVLFGVRFDARNLTTVGGPTPLRTGLRRSESPARNSAAGNWAFSADGTLAHIRADGSAGAGQLVWVDRSGRAEPVAALSPGRYEMPRLDRAAKSWLADCRCDTMRLATFVQPDKVQRTI
jgi:hypothetical protein